MCLSAPFNNFLIIFLTNTVPLFFVEVKKIKKIFYFYLST